MLFRSSIRRKRTVGHKTDKGYIVIEILGKRYKAHRLAHLYMTGEYTTLLIDHIDCNKSNNAWVNLRTGTNQENSRNRDVSKTKSTSLPKGVFHYPKLKKPYRAKIGIDGKVKHLGYYSTQEEAKMAYNTHAKEIFGEFYRE